MKKTVMTISGIRPDFIRMAHIFKKFDENYNHILVHSGQHYDQLLSGVFFQELNIRKPDYVLDTGHHASNHYEQLGYLSKAVIELIKSQNLKPDIIFFLGDSNSVCASLPLRKEGYIIGHIEAGMRSYDKRMLEEINRTVCDHCSHLLFVYHDDYKKQIEKENITENVHVVGNTIVEVCQPFIPKEPKRNDMILLDIHRPENFKYPDRLRNIIKYANQCREKYGLTVKMLKFHGTCQHLEQHQIDLGLVELVDLLPYKKYLETVYHSKFIISDSGTGQEEPSLLGTPVIVPRDFTERPQSMTHNCSYMLRVDDLSNSEQSHQWLGDIFSGKLKISSNWLGDGRTSELIVKHLDDYFSRL